MGPRCIGTVNPRTQMLINQSINELSEDVCDLTKDIPCLKDIVLD